MCLLQYVAANHASHVKLGYMDHIEQSLLWVLSRLNVQMKQPLIMGEKINIEAWPRETFKLFSIRNFLISNKKNACITKASSA
jgi:acyl-ACP thioesterase